MKQATNFELSRAEEALDNVQEEWLTRQGVTGIDIGFKWSHGKMTEQLAVRVHVSKKKRAESLQPSEIFPKQIDLVAVDVIEARYHLPADPDSSTKKSVSGLESIGVTVAESALNLGSSIGNQYVTAGTLGAKVIDLDGGDEMILSNWHVLAGHPEADIGLPIWQPGSIDGGTDKDTFAQLTRWIIGPYDAAVAKLNGTRAVSDHIDSGQPILEVIPPKPGMMVWKFGRTTGYTEGFIDGAKGNMPIIYKSLGTTVVLQDVFRILPLPGQAGEISMPGDSGSVWVDKATGKAVGLHCAGEVGDFDEYALAHDLGAVLRALFVRLPAQPPPEPPVPPILVNTPEPPSAPPAEHPSEPPTSSPSVTNRSVGWIEMIFEFFKRIFGIE